MKRVTLAEDGTTLMAINLVLLDFQNTLTPEHQDRLFSCLLRAIVSLQSLVYQRSSFTMKAESLFKELLDQLMLNTTSRAGDFIRVSI